MFVDTVHGQQCVICVIVEHFIPKKVDVNLLL